MKNAVQDKNLEEAIAGMITRCLQTGDKFPSEKQLVKDLGVSRGAIRESLSGFEVSGIITSQQGSGRSVQIPDVGGHITGTWGILFRARPDLLMDFIEIRSILEIHSLGKAMERVDVNQLQHMGEQVKRMKQKAGRDEAFIAEDRAFHKTLFESTGNILLEQLLTAFWDLYEMSHINPLNSNLRDVACLHEKMFEAFTRQDLPRLESLMKEQFAEARYRIAQFLMSRPGSQGA